MCAEMTIHSSRNFGSLPSILASTLRSGTFVRVTDVTSCISGPGSVTAARPLGVSDAFDNSSSVLPDPLTRSAASAGDICAAGIVTALVHASSEYEPSRDGWAGHAP